MTAELEELARQVIEAAIARGVHLATAESLTGGMLGDFLCTVPGASATYYGGVISYANEVKQTVLGVEEELLAEQGSVDPLVAEQMAQGAARVCGAEFAISTTGVAGPAPHDGKPVGRVYLGILTPEGSRSVEQQYSGNRREIRLQAAGDALHLLLGALISSSPASP